MADKVWLTDTDTDTDTEVGNGSAVPANESGANPKQIPYFPSLQQYI
jgi:hypothetical protein